jgi:hypothetical protein
MRGHSLTKVTGFGHELHFFPPRKGDVTNYSLARISTIERSQRVWTLVAGQGSALGARARGPQAGEADRSAQGRRTIRTPYARVTGWSMSRDGFGNFA